MAILKSLAFFFFQKNTNDDVAPLSYILVVKDSMNSSKSITPNDVPSATSVSSLSELVAELRP